MTSLGVLSFCALALLNSPVAAQEARPAEQAARFIAHQTLKLQDRDHDGRISLKESAGAALSLFYAMDTDQSTLVSSTEMSGVVSNDVAALRISTTDAQTEALVTARIQAMDIDGDGSISLTELMAVMQTVFDTADSDANGYVTENEMVTLALGQTSTQETR